MEALGELLSFAYKEEARILKTEAEWRLFPLWLANYALARMRGDESVMEYGQFLESVFSGKKETAAKKTAEEIEQDLLRFVKADREKGG